MKNKIFYFLVFTIYTSYSQINTAIITYKKTHTKRIFGNDKQGKLSKEKLQKFAAIEKKSNTIASKINFKLLYNKEEALFKADKLLNLPNNNFYNMALLPFGTGVYYNTPKSKLRKINNFGEDFIVNYPKNYTKWTLSKDKKSIGKYKVYKATAKEKIKLRNGTFKSYIITAWYAPSINIPFGPIGYAGLPGLILELNKKNITYYVHHIALNPKTKITIKKPTKGTNISLEDYKKAGKNAMSRYKKIRS